jgi:hypothetical protein
MPKYHNRKYFPCGLTDEVLNEAIEQFSFKAAIKVAGIVLKNEYLIGFNITRSH